MCSYIHICITHNVEEHNFRIKKEEILIDRFVFPIYKIKMQTRSFDLRK